MSSRLRIRRAWRQLLGKPGAQRNPIVVAVGEGVGGLPESLTIDIHGCARCHGQGHDQVTFRALRYPIAGHGEPVLTHWAPCPANGEPILLARLKAEPSRPR